MCRWMARSTSGPSLAGGMLYVSTEAGTLYAIAGMGDATPEATPLPVAAASPVAGNVGSNFSGRPISATRSGSRPEPP